MHHKLTIFSSHSLTAIALRIHSDRNSHTRRTAHPLPYHDNSHPNSNQITFSYLRPLANRDDRPIPSLFDFIRELWNSNLLGKGSVIFVIGFLSIALLSVLIVLVLSVFAPKHCKRKHEEQKGKTKDPENSLESSDALLGTGQSMKELIRKESIISVSMLDDEDSGSGKGKATFCLLFNLFEQKEIELIK